MTAFCPHCGYDISRDEPVAVGELLFDPRGPVAWKGKPLDITPGDRVVLGSLVKAPGKIVSKEVLAERMGYEGSDPTRTAVAIKHIRRAIRSVDPMANPILTHYGLGYSIGARA